MQILWIIWSKLIGFNPAKLLLGLTLCRHYQTWRSQWQPPLVIARPQAVAIQGFTALVFARSEVTWQSMAQGKALYLDVSHGLLRYARNDGTSSLSDLAPAVIIALDAVISLCHVRSPGQAGGWRRGRAWRQSVIIGLDPIISLCRVRSPGRAGGWRGGLKDDGGFEMLHYACKDV